MRINDHQDDEGQHENNRANNGDAVKVLFDDARAGLRRIHRAGDHVGDTGSLARMHEDEHDHTDTGQNQQNQKDNNQRTQGFTLLSCEYADTQVCQYNG